MPILLASLVAGTMTVCAGPPGDCGFVAQWHGQGERRDCGVHTFKRDDGTVVRVTISCPRS